MPDRSLHILIVEDNPDTLQALSLLLGGVCLLEIEAAGTLADARLALHRREPAACIIDLHLPDGTGLELLRDIRSFYPDVRTIVASAYISQTARLTAERLGADAILVKPLDSAACMSALGVVRPEPLP